MPPPQLPHPWRDLRTNHPHIDVHWADLPHGIWALTDGVARIWMHRGLVQRERRSTLAHELVHLRRDHRGCQPPRVERQVRAAAAAWLLPDITAVADALCFYGDDYDGAADDLWVDEPTLWARLDPVHAPAAERAYVARRLEEL
ncbi:ImmA/IrrE family metallo-endopeptidase [Propionibacteriaceae bacterium Y2011]